MTLDALYSKAVLRLAGAAHGAGPLPEGARIVTKVNPSCGDRIDMAMTVTDGAVTAYAYDVKACLLCQASASALGVGIIGRKPHEIKALHGVVHKMLKAFGAPPQTPFEEYSALSPVLYEKGRHSCVMLALDAALEALDLHAE